MNVHLSDLVDSSRASLDDKVTLSVYLKFSLFSVSLCHDQGNLSLEYKRGILFNIIRVRIFEVIAALISS
jgi:hypothetical protein